MHRRRAMTEAVLAAIPEMKHGANPSLGPRGTRGTCTYAAHHVSEFISVIGEVTLSFIKRSGRSTVDTAGLLRLNKCSLCKIPLTPVGPTPGTHPRDDPLEGDR